jgi:hypothetical protein
MLRAAFGDLGNQFATSRCMLKVVNRLSAIICDDMFGPNTNGEVGILSTAGGRDDPGDSGGPG